jgi:hypothetical protein
VRQTKPPSHRNSRFQQARKGVPHAGLSLRVRWVRPAHASFIHYVVMGSTQRHRQGGTRGAGGSSGWIGQPAAIYCRISKARDEDQGIVRLTMIMIFFVSSSAK